ncbi:hypothetical protein P7K49_027462 [Saguinus oedipus]|uniref:FHA domain-containing protein n=1 Tax=Saguinus oedipus TaxID=9490 RepID=A0ABQ9U9I4_SAGOE|nr:hypothetical protein P7K49_027462 [Saguinus oedipus]
MDKDSQGLLYSSLMASGTASHSEDEESLAGQNWASSQALGTISKWRSSSRFIKRKKFNDKQPPALLCHAAQPQPPGLTKYMKKNKQPLQVTKDMGHWKPADDLLLFNAVLQTNDLTSIHLGIHPEQSPFQQAKEQLLRKVGSISQPILETFQDMLHRHPDVFYLACTAKALQAHWQLMKHYYPLEGQKVQSLPKGTKATNDNQIDVDLSLEGPAWKISRKQGVIKLKNKGDFFITNEGRRPIYINGQPVLCGSKWCLSNNSVIEIASQPFISLINQDLIALIRAEAAKITPQ